MFFEMHTTSSQFDCAKCVLIPWSIAELDRGLIGQMDVKDRVNSLERIQPHHPLATNNSDLSSHIRPSHNQNLLQDYDQKTKSTTTSIGPQRYSQRASSKIYYIAQTTSPRLTSPTNHPLQVFLNLPSLIISNHNLLHFLLPLHLQREMRDHQLRSRKSKLPHKIGKGRIAPSG